MTSDNVNIRPTCFCRIKNVGWARFFAHHAIWWNHYIRFALCILMFSFLWRSWAGWFGGHKKHAHPTHSPH